MRARIQVFLSLLLLTTPVQAQQLVDDGVDDRIEALNAVFRFRNDLRPDSTVIARCRIPTAHPDSGSVAGLDARFQALLVRPDSIQVQKVGLAGLDGCPVYGFADRKLHVLWLQDLIEVRKSTSTTILPKVHAHHFEITFQLLAGPSYREFHRYIVEPIGVTTLPNQKYKFEGWRVIEYRLTGWDYHWGDHLGHGSGVRR